MNRTTEPRPELSLKGALDLAPSPESIPVRVPERVGHFIAGDFVPGRDE